MTRALTRFLCLLALLAVALYGAAAGAMVDELGDGFGDKAGALLAQAVTTLATDAALNAQVSGASVKEVTQLARAAKDALHTRTLSFKEREAIEEHARRKMLEQQQAKAQELTRAGVPAQEVLAQVIRAGYGL